MKTIKITSIVLLSAFFLCAFIPQAEAKHYNKYKCKSKCRSTSFALNFNVDPQPRYVEYNYVAPAPVYQSVPVVAYQPYVAERIYYPCYQQQVVVQRPYVQPMYVQPSFSYSYWKY